MNISLDRAAQEALFNLPNNDGVFSGELQGYLGALGARRPAIVLAFPPKAAGTFLRAAAIKATGGELLRIVYAQGGRDAQLYLPTLVAYYLGGFCEGPMVTHIHMQAFPANISVLQAFGIRPVVMIRSIPDMLASYWDMLEGSDDALRQGLNCTIPPDFRNMGADRKADFLIDVLGPLVCRLLCNLAGACGTERRCLRPALFRFRARACRDAGDAAETCRRAAHA